MSIKHGNKKFIFGVVKVSDKGQILIPKEARDTFKIEPGDSLILLGDIEKGLALVKTEVFAPFTESIMGDNNDNNKDK